MDDQVQENQDIQENTEVEETPTEDTPTEQDALENSKNPERTKKFIDKLKDENKKYKDVLSSLTPEQNSPQVPNQDQFSNLNQSDIDAVYKSMVDDKGYIDGNKLLNTLQGMDKRARDAEQRAARVEEHVRRVETAQTEQQKTQTMKAVHEKFPQLDPDNEQFDPRYWEFVRNDLIGQMMQGKQDPMASAQKGFDIFYKKSTQLDENPEENPMNKAQKEAKAVSDNAKAQINATKPRVSSTSDYDHDEEQDLISRARAGKRGAVAELLRRRGQ